MTGYWRGKAFTKEGKKDAPVNVKGSTNSRGRQAPSRKTKCETCGKPTKQAARRCDSCVKASIGFQKITPAQGGKDLKNGNKIDRRGTEWCGVCGNYVKDGEVYKLEMLDQVGKPDHEYIVIALPGNKISFYCSVCKRDVKVVTGPVVSLVDIVGWMEVHDMEKVETK